MIADQANDEGMGWPSIASIVRGTEIGRRTVLRVMQVFEAIELLARRKTFVNDRFGAREVNAIYLNLALLATDLTQKFGAAYADAQGKKCTRGGVEDVSAARESVSETQGGVAETLPLEPLSGRPMIDPLFDPPAAARVEAAENAFRPKQQEHLDRLAAEGREAAGWERFYADENRQAAETRAALAAEEAELQREFPDVESGLAKMRKRCGFARREGDELGPVLRQVVADQAEMGKPFWRTIAQMEAAWKLQRRQGRRLRARYGPMSFFADGHWLDSDGWHWDTEYLKREGAGAGSER